MAFKKFDEYMNEKGKIESPKIAVNADYDGPIPKSPEKGDLWVMKGAKSVSDTDSKSVGQKKLGDYISTSSKPWVQTKDLPEDGLVTKRGELKTKATVPSVAKYPDPPTLKEAPAKKLYKTAPSAYPSSDTEHNKPWKSKTEDFVDKTSKMSISEFTQYMLKECSHCPDCEEEDGEEETPKITAYKIGKIEPHVPEVIKFLTHICAKNPRVLENLIHEMKREGLMGKIISTSMEHPEGIESITDVLDHPEDGPRHARSIVRSMDDKYNKFADEMDDQFEESVAPPFDFDDEEDSGPNMGHNDANSDEESPEDSNQEDQEDSDSPNEPTDHEGPPDQDFEDKPADEEKPKKKLRKKFGHDHLLSAMADVGHLKEKMKHYCMP